jgi:osmotically-inducible protein OsmY
VVPATPAYAEERAMSVRQRNRNVPARPAATAPQRELATPLAMRQAGRAVVVNPVTPTMRGSDRDIQAQVAEELRYTPGVDTHVGVAVTGGVVTLSGEVGSLAERTAVKRTAMLVAGVKALADELQIRAPGTSGTKDTDM